MTDPYQQYGPQYGAPGTGPDLSKGPGGAPGYPSQPPQPQQPPPYPSSPQPYPSQPAYGDPSQQQYGSMPGAPMPGQPPMGFQGGQMPGGYNPMDPEAPYGRDMYGTPYSDKSKTTAGLLQILLGSFGAGRWYLGDNTTAILQILVTWLTCGLGAIWPLIDGIQMLTGKVTDSYGRPLHD